MAKPLTPVEQLAYTDGACHLFVRALARLVPGRHVVLCCTDPAVLDRHDWPRDEPIELHECLLLEDGRLADAEGVRPLAAMARGFGAAPATVDRHVFMRPAAPEGPLAPAQARMIDKIERRLRDLGWARALPEATDALADPADFARARRQLQQWWPQWERDGSLPENPPAPPGRPRSRAR